MSVLYSYTMKTIDGEMRSLGAYRDRALLVVNVASKCGLTPQYKGLESLYEEYSRRGLEILGFPCNQFGRQEPGTPTEIKEFCQINYGVGFDLFSKIEVNGDGACDIYKHLTALDTKPVGPGKISWNFEKFIIGRNGEIAARFSPRTKPDDAEVLKVIEAELAKK